MTDKGLIHSRKTEKDSILTNHTSDSDINYPTCSDMKICYATTPGFVSHRDPYFGSWYVHGMCKVWSANAHNTHLDYLLKLVGEAVQTLRNSSYELQTPGNEDRGFTKNLFFNPGFYEK